VDLAEFIRLHPNFVLSIGGILLGLIVYLYKQNETKSARLIADKLEDIVTGLNKLFKLDERKASTLSDHERRLSVQERRCDDREESCPGKQACRTLSRQEDHQIFRSSKERQVTP
jgi:hypothetical protein